MNHELRYKILKILQENPETNQRELAKKLGVSLGKTNFCIRALIEKGLLKAKRFKSSKNKLAYFYVLTPGGIEEKAKVTLRFLKFKIEEYEIMKKEIQELKKEMSSIK